MELQRLATGRNGSRSLPPNHPAYAEIGLIDPEGSGRASYEIVPGLVTRLTPHVRRLTAPNPGYMTGPGTNSYLVGARDEVAVVDPGPFNEDHIAALLDVGVRIRWILVTHTHPDHSPAAARLKEATGATVIGMPPPQGQHQDQTFRPDIVPEDGDYLPLGGCSLRAVHTAGHASNHLCYQLEDAGILFTGDHVMQGSTVVINPPDGDMTAYIDSLRRLQGTGLSYLAPGHGFLIGQPDDMLDLLIRHRLLRERKTLSALRNSGSVSLEELTPLVYDDVPPFKHVWAARSLLAHLLKLEQDGHAVRRADLWQAK
jgi:glyoxylase-like metal-dependent hydrolase (beta-lactamase superfamily II)